MLEMFLDYFLKGRQLRRQFLDIAVHRRAEKVGLLSQRRDDRKLKGRGAFMLL